MKQYLPVLALIAACSGEREHTRTPPFTVGANVSRGHTHAWVQMMPAGRGVMIPVTHPEQWRVAFDSDFGVFSVSGRDWYERFADGARVSIDVCAVYEDMNRDGVLAESEIVDFELVSVRSGDVVTPR